MQEKSLKTNVILNGIRTFLFIVFPLITFPYVSRMLGVENLGKVNFTIAVISYFSLLAGLGTRNYAIREGGIVRNDTARRTIFFNEIYSINMAATVLSYLLLACSLFAFPVLRSYTGLLLIYSIVIIGRTFGVDWMCSVYEDYRYITIRTLLIQVLSLIFVFCFIHEQKDYYIYTWIMMFQATAEGVLNHLYFARKHKFQLTWKMNLKRHLRPVMTLFATEVATTIYVSSDAVLIGLLVGDYYNGLYSVSTRIYDVVKLALLAVFQVSIPRLSKYFDSEDLHRFDDTIEEMCKTMMLAMFPAITGMILCAKEIVLLIGGTAYIDATLSLQILAISVLFSVSALFFAQCILVPKKLEKIMLRTALISAILNILLNLVLIPTGKQDAAAVTTVVSEILNFIVFYFYARKHLHLKNLLFHGVQSLIACTGMTVYLILLHLVVENEMLYLLVAILGGAMVYAILLYVQKNALFMNYVRGAKRRLKK